MFEVEVPLPGVVHIIFDTQRDLALTMCRVQEFYEGPFEHIKGQFFTFEQFIEAYSDDDGILTYFQQWNGFNVPRSALEQFWDLFSTRGGGLSVREHQLFDVVRTTNCRYLIATCKMTDYATVDHELAHALWTTDVSYRETALGILSLLDPAVKLQIAECLIEAGYPTDPEIMDDEIHAYLGTLPQVEFLTFFKEVNPSDVADVQDALYALLSDRLE